LYELVDDLPVGVWVARVPNGDLIYANRRFAEIMGQTGRDDVTVGGYSEPYGILTRDGKPYPERRMPFVRAVEERQVVVVDDLTIRRPDRAHVHVRAYANPVMDEAGVISHVVIVFFDITREVDAELARAEADRRLHAAQRLEAVGTLAGGIAHDFNNLIFGIKLIAAELALDETDEKRKRALALIDDITERSALLTRSLLGFARRGIARKMPVALDDVVAAMHEMLARTMANVTIEFELAAEHRGAVIADRAQLEQVVMNLVVNARDALQAADHGRVMVTTRSVNDRVILEVSDDGPGVAPEMRDHLFEPYVSTKTQCAEHGTGLGLATVFGIVDSHGGTIELAPGLDGRGVTFRVSLPAAGCGAELPAPAAPELPLPVGSGTLLVVDDDPLLRDALARVLVGLGYTALVAASGGEAVAIFEREPERITGVLLDMIMPGMSGVSTFTALRSIRGDLPVLLMSGHARAEDVEPLLAAGARGLVMKPYSIQALGRALLQALG